MSAYRMLYMMYDSAVGRIRMTSRRDFLKATGAAGGLLAASAVFGPGYAAAADDPWARVPVILGRIKPPVFPDRVFDIRSYGAVGDDKTDCTPAFKAAIAACNAAGGGRV